MITKISKKNILRLCLCFLFFLLGVNPALFAQGGKIVAIVNNEVITQKDLDDFMGFTSMQLSSQYSGEELEGKIKEMKEDLLDKLIEDKLISSEAKREKIQVDKNRIKAKIDEIRAHYATPQEFQDSLDRQGMVLADLEKRIEEQLLMYAVVDVKVRNHISVNPREVTDFYKTHSNDFTIPVSWEFDTISANNKEDADKIFEELKSGKSLEESAKIYSYTPNKLEMKKGQFKKEVEDIVSKLAAGEFSAPIEIENKFFIFKMAKITPPQQRPLSESQDAIYSQLMNKKMVEEMVTWLGEIKKRSYIKIIKQ